MARFSAPLLDPNGKARSCSLPQKKALFVFMFWMTLLHSWHLVSALGVHASPRSPGSQEVVTEPLRITNNNVTYPRLRDERTRMTQNEAQTFYDRIVALREGKFIFQPEHDFVEGNNWKEMDRLREYLALAKMETTSARPMVILSSWHWMPCSWAADCTPGEAVWMKSLLEIIKHHNIFLLYTNWNTFRRDWKLLGNDLITHIWADENHVLWCFNDIEGCIQSPYNPQGVPPHKLFAFTYWGATPGSGTWGGSPTRPWMFNPLGSEWSLVPYEMPEGQFYLGYHYQRCSSLPIVPAQWRKNRIVVLAKKSNYFYEQPVFDPKTFYGNLRRKTGMDIVTNALVSDGYPIPPGLTPFGELSPEDYDQLLAESKAVLGISRPILSPTPYASLCRGVPVIMPYKSKLDESRTCSAAPPPSDWCGFDMERHQHGPAGRIGEPYVYMVDTIGAKDSVLDIIRRAVTTPIGQYEPPDMKYEAVEQRLLDFFAIDWEVYASKKQSLGLAPDSLEIEDWQHGWIRWNRDPERPDLS